MELLVLELCFFLFFSPLFIYLSVFLFEISDVKMQSVSIHVFFYGNSETLCGKIFLEVIMRTFS